MSIVIKAWDANGQYGPDELNRVEANTEYIAAFLAAVGYPVVLESVIVNRSMSDYEFSDSLNRVERNIDALVQAFVTPPGYQAPEEWAANTRHDYRDANRLEQNLQIIYDWALGIVASFRLCGTLACGEDGGIY